MAVADPTYPLFPVLSVLAAALLCLVLFTSFIRQRWNLGVAFLSFWLALENVIYGVNAVVWADNADIKFHVYCDVVSRVQLIALVVRPMATLILSRQLYLIASLHSVYLPDKDAKRKNLAIELILGLVIPLLVAGPFYYVVQKRRFQVVEGFGCASYQDASVLGILVIWTWNVIPPLFSIVIYYPTVIRVFYHHNRDVNHILHSDGSISHINYLRILALANIDIILTLPVGIASVILVVKTLSFTSLSFYSGWTYVHSDWDPLSASYAELVASGTFTVAEVYFVHWTPIFLSFVIFGLFGVSTEARASYWHAIYTVGWRFGWKPDPSACGLRSMLSAMEFDEPPPDMLPNVENLAQREREESNRDSA